MGNTNKMPPNNKYVIFPVNSCGMSYRHQLFELYEIIFEFSFGNNSNYDPSRMSWEKFPRAEIRKNENPVG
jgi:hypothetical protein